MFIALIPTCAQNKGQDHARSKFHANFTCRAVYAASPSPALLRSSISLVLYIRYFFGSRNNGLKALKMAFFHDTNTNMYIIRKG